VGLRLEILSVKANLRSRLKTAFPSGRSQKKFFEPALLSISAKALCLGIEMTEEEFLKRRPVVLRRKCGRSVGVC
jgi:hypothetical protein